jgi:hypothetical protein
MMLERKGLYPREVAIVEELREIGERLGVLARKLRQDATALGADDLAWIESCSVGDLVGDLQKTKSRIQELDAALERSGL